MQPPFRIAILECDTPLTGTRTRYGGYGGVFKALLEAGAQALAAQDPDTPAPALELSSYDVVTKQEYPDVAAVDAVLLTGSKHNSFGPDAWIVRLVEFTRRLLRDQGRVRVIGVCFGHQIVGRALGARVARSEGGWEMSVTPMELTSVGRELFKKEDDDGMSLFQMHRDIVYEYPDGVLPLAHTPRCTNQGMYAKNRLVTVQGHPEFTRDIVEELLVARHDSGVFDDTMFGDGMERVGKPHDGVAVGAAFLRFLLQD